MLQLIFQGFVEWSYGLTLEAWQYFSSALLDVMSLDFQYLKTHIPVIDEIILVLVAVGWALLIGNLAFQALKSMVSGLGFEGEDPKFLFARTFVFGFLLLVSPEICEIGLGITSNVIALLQVPNAINVTFLDAAAFSPLNASWLIVIIFDVILMFKVFQMILEMAERYVILAMLTITAPLAFAMGGSRATSEIFTGWCRMYGSMCLLMVTHVIFFKLLLSVVSTVPGGIDVLPWMILILAIVKVARKADAIVTRIGLNPAITGDSLGLRLPGFLSYAIVRTATKTASAAAGKMFGTPAAAGGANGFQFRGMGGAQRAGRKTSTAYGAYTATNHSVADMKSDVMQQPAEVKQGPDPNGENTQHPRPADAVTFVPGNRESGTKRAERMGKVDGFAIPRATAVPLGTRRSPAYVRPAEGEKAAGGAVKGRPEAHYEKTAVGIKSGKENVPQPDTAGTVSTRITRAGTERRQIIRSESERATPYQAGGINHHVSGGAVVHTDKTPVSGDTGGVDRQTRFTSQANQTQMKVTADRERLLQTQSVQPGTAGMAHPSSGTVAQNRAQMAAPSSVVAPAALRMTERPAVTATENTSAVKKETVPSARDGRNPAPVQRVLSGEHQSPSPARQELRQTSRGAVATEERKTIVNRPGVAGTAQRIQPTQQTRQSVKTLNPEPQARIMNSQPMDKRQLNHPTPKGNGKQEVKPSRQTRGKDYGR